MTGKSGYRGVTKFRNKWRATCAIGGSQTYLGLFDTPEEANDRVLAVKATLPVKPKPIAPPPVPLEVKYRPPKKAVVPRKPRFVASDLRWAHLWAISHCLDHGMTVTQAADEVGVSRAVWAQLRSKTSPIDVVALLAVNDPDGAPLDMTILDAQIAAKFVGRPPTAKSIKRNKQRKTPRTYKPKPVARYVAPEDDRYGSEGQRPNVAGAPAKELLGPVAFGFDG